MVYINNNGKLHIQLKLYNVQISYFSSESRTTNTHTVWLSCFQLHPGSMLESNVSSAKCMKFALSNYLKKISNRLFSSTLSSKAIIRAGTSKSQTIPSYENSSNTKHKPSNKFCSCIKGQQVCALQNFRSCFNVGRLDVYGKIFLQLRDILF